MHDSVINLHLICPNELAIIDTIGTPKYVSYFVSYFDIYLEMYNTGGHHAKLHDKLDDSNFP